MHLEIELIVENSEHALCGNMSPDACRIALAQIDSASKSIRALWTLALEDQLTSNARSDFPGEDYFSEKLSGLVSFARMALGVEDRLSYSDAFILENVRHFASRVQSIIGDIER
ncbi:hypothetical protein [Hyphomonas sp.]|uniref:hypothetical protein n=1 Tax=Hyphomonas sp. TaxID=87 RepID=UPI0025C734EE|nr:hypothetical protein [Hyphomonas sp.]